MGSCGGRSAAFLHHRTHVLARLVELPALLRELCVFVSHLVACNQWDMEIIEAKDNSTPLQINRAGEILAPPRFNLATRYQIARFAQPVEYQGKGYLYRISASGLATAQDQGLTPTMLERMLHKYSRGSIPPNVRNALHAWEQTGAQVRIGEVILLRVSEPQVIRRLKESSAARYLGESFGSTAVEIKPGAEDKIRQILGEMGLIL